MKKSILIISGSVLFLFACTSSKNKLKAKISANEKIILADEMVTPKEDSIASVLISDFQTYAKENPDDSLAVEYLYKAAEYSKGISKFKQAADLYGIIFAKYPTSKKAAISLFNQAFTYQDNMNDTIKAKLIFKDFIAKYPNHPFVKDAKISIEQMENKLSNGEIVAGFMKKLEEKNKTKSAQ
jgi:outer membrane protein assembly factor BamD (BamD/ComL family)